MAKKPSDIRKLIEDHDVKMVDIRFVDVPGTWQHNSVPADAMDEDALVNGIGFDGSSIRGFQSIHESDMILKPDLETAHLDGFRTHPTLAVICDVYDPIKNSWYDRDPRYIAKRAEEYLRTSGIGDTAYFGPEAEFYILDSVAYENEPQSTGYALDSVEGHWNSGEPGPGYTIRNKEGYYPVPPADHLQDIRAEMAIELGRWGISVEMQHHEVATAGQAEIDMRFGSLVNMADNMMIYKYVIKNVAAAHGKTVTFMPKPLFGDNGSGMHTHQSLWKDGKPLFAGNGYAGLSETALFYIGGIIKHARAINALTNPTTNSYKRLAPGFEAPVMLAYSARNRSASIRVPWVSSPKARRIEVRFPDGATNPYLGFAAMLMAGLDGIQNKIHPGEPADKDLYDLEPEEAKHIPTVCHSLDMALEYLDKDREFLKRGGVFTDDVIDSYIALKMQEVTRLRMTTHPVEFDMYYSV